jgi:hypothetical protein
LFDSILSLPELDVKERFMDFQPVTCCSHEAASEQRLATANGTPSGMARVLEDVK